MSKKKIVILLFSLLLVLILIVGFIIFRVFFSLQSVPQGELIRSIQSPDRKYVIKTYFHQGNSLSADAVRGELVDLKRQKKKNIYWNFHDEDPYVKWLNNSEVLIGNQKLNILKGETYDWRNDQNLSRELPKQFPKSNQHETD